MSSVELRRFRTWNPDAASSRPSWRIILRYHARTFLRTWYTATFLVITAVLLLISFGTALAGWTHPRYPDSLTYGDVGYGALILSLLPAAAFVLLVGAPLFAEDLRYNAPLFYFSRPLRRGAYFQGKLAFLSGLLLAVAFVPVVLLLLLGMLLRVGPQTIANSGPRALVDGADALHALAVVVPALLTILLWLVAVTLFISVHTRRTWHAAMGVAVLVGAWSLVGGTAQMLGDSALKYLGGPTGWVQLLLFHPFEVRYHDRIAEHYAAQGQHWFDAVPPADHALTGLAMALTYALMLGTSLLLLWATRRRLHKVEALL